MTFVHEGVTLCCKEMLLQAPTKIYPYTVNCHCLFARFISSYIIATRNRVHPYNYGNVVYILHFSVIVILASAVFLS